MISPFRNAAMELLHPMTHLATLHPPDGLLLLNTAQLALGNEPALAADSGKHTTLDHLFAEPLEQLILRFVGAQNDNSHV